MLFFNQNEVVWLWLNWIEFFTQLDLVLGCFSFCKLIGERIEQIITHSTYSISQENSVSQYLGKFTFSFFVEWAGTEVSLKIFDFDLTPLSLILLRNWIVCYPQQGSFELLKLNKLCTEKPRAIKNVYTLFKHGKFAFCHSDKLWLNTFYQQNSLSLWYLEICNMKILMNSCGILLLDYQW